MSLTPAITYSAFLPNGEPVEAGTILYSAHDGNAYEFLSVEFNRAHKAPMVRAINKDRGTKTITVLSPSLLGIVAHKN